jgi:hypothetical protein
MQVNPREVDTSGDFDLLSVSRMAAEGGGSCCAVE